MNMNTIRAMAKRMSIDPGSMSKLELVRYIQEKEGNIPCFKTDQPACDQLDCCWRSDCKPGEMIALS